MRTWHPSGVRAAVGLTAGAQWLGAWGQTVPRMVEILRCAESLLQVTTQSNLLTKHLMRVTLS